MPLIVGLQALPYAKSAWLRLVLGVAMGVCVVNLLIVIAGIERYALWSSLQFVALIIFGAIFMAGTIRRYREAP